MTEKHSPLPWIAYGQHVQEDVSGHNMNVAWCGSVYGAGMVNGRAESFSITEEQAEANAALIVRSVNGLPEAIAALEELHALVWGECPSLLNEDSGGSVELDVRIRDILTKLKG